MQYNMGKDQKNKQEVKYPRIVSTAPCNDDWFAGQSHKRIAGIIADVILDDTQHGIIGIDGGWGSGKSNLVGLTHKAINEKIKDDNKKKYVFVTFDVWAHHTDYLRRSLLEEFIKSLMDQKVLDDSWLEMIDMLLAKVREIDTKKIVKLNEMVIATAILAAVMPIIHTLSDYWKYGFILAILAYVIVLIWFVSSRYWSMKKYGPKFTFSNFISECVRLYVDKSNIESKQGYSEVNNKNSESKTVEFITEKEPTARQFRDWMHRIDEELKSKNTHVVFVIDNMDRLPIVKVKETWATIHAFFAECEYEYIHTVIPFDRSHIINAFKEENIKSEKIKEKQKKDGQEKEERITKKLEVNSYGNDFINKTFYVVYRVSPPILSDWREYFERIWKMAFGDDIYKNHDELLLVFEKLSPDFTPRSIIAFINECATLHTVLEEEIPSEYLGIYILGKERICENPDEQLVNPDFLQGLTEKYAKDEELPKYLSAIHYQIKKEKALDVVYLPKVKKAVDDGDVSFIGQINNDRVLNALLPNAIGAVKNEDKAIDFMQAVSVRDNASENFRLDYLWDALFLRIKETGYTVLNFNEHHGRLLEHCTDKKAVVDYFMGHYLEMAKDWNVMDYVTGVKVFRGLAKEETDAYIIEHPTEAKAEIIEELLWKEKEHYLDYGLKMNAEGFDRYLAKKDVEQFEKVDYLPLILSEDCTLDKTWEQLLELAKGTDDAQEHMTLLKRMKEINYKNRMRGLLYPLDSDDRNPERTYSDNKIYNLYIGLDGEDELMADIIAMRIARKTDFKPNGVPVDKTAFQAELSNEDEVFVKRVADELLYYTDYGTFMVYLEDIEQHQLVGAIARELTLNETKLEKTISSKDQMLLYFDGIIETSGLEPKDVLEQIQNCRGGKIEYENFDEWPISLFASCKELDLDVAKEINKHSSGYLMAVSTDDWQKQLIKPEFVFNLWDVYQLELINLKDAAINVLMHYATEGNNKPDKSRVEKVLSGYSDAKYKLKESFKEIYDVIVKKPSKDNVSYFTSWFFEYRVIDNEGGVAALYKTVLLDDSTVLNELINVGDKLNGIKLPEDFVTKMAQMAIGNRKNEESFVGMCRNNGQINAEMEKQLHPEGEDEDKKS